MKRRLVLIGLVLVASVTVYPAPKEATKAKAPWQWTTDERIAARFDDTARKLRVDAALAERHAASAKEGTRATAIPATEYHPADVIRGARNPELLLSFEILGIFTRAAYSEDDDVARDVRTHATSNAIALGLPPDFLSTLEGDAHEFILLQRHEFELRRKLATGRGNSDVIAELKNVEIAECRPRAAAIRSLRAKFHAQFDRFLYTVIAPGVFEDFERPQNPAELRRQEEGCL